MQDNRDVAESKSDRFRRLASGRTNQVRNALRKLANLANRHAYEFDDDDVEAIFAAIQKRVDLARRRFEAELEFGSTRREEFRL